MSRARSVADLGNQTVLDVNAGDGTLKVGAGVTLENTGEAQFSGIVTASSIDTRNLIGNVSIGGTLTYEDVTNVDSVGIITAGNGLRVTDGGLVVSSGISTFAGITTVTGETLFTKQLNVSGISTLGSNVVVGGATTELVVTGDARVTGNIAGASLYDTQVSAISKEITDSAVDVFVYDTSKDSDGGAWRKKTKHTSWYNEAASLTRGSRKEFPAVAVIVAEATKITIYDGDDPDLSTWMVFNVSNNTWLKLYSSAAQCSCITALNGILCAGGNGTGIRLAVVDFIKDNQYLTEAGYTYYNNGIETRNDTTTFSDDGGSKSIVNNVINDVAMTVLPNAPIDDATGLPVPTIAVATDGGVSVIKDDGTVVDITNGIGNTKVAFIDGGNRLMVSRNTQTTVETGEIPTADIAASSWRHTYYNDASVVATLGSDNAKKLAENTSVGGNSGLSLINENLSSGTNGLVAYATTSYNTGYMHGDIKGAFLSDTDTTNATELVTNGYFDSDLNGWTTPIGTSTLDANRLLITAPNGGASWGYAHTSITTEINKTYKISLHYDKGTADGRLVVKNDSTNSSAGLLEGTGVNAGGWRDLGSSDDGKTIFATFTATAPTTFILVFSKSTSGGTSAYDQISVTLEKDRSINGKGLSVFGTVTKSVVATGAELVAYSGFSLNDYLKQPHNSDMQTGTGEFSVSAWFKTTSTSDQYEGLVYYNRNESLGTGFQIMLEPISSGKGIYFYIYGASTQVSTTPVDGLNDGEWHQVVATYSNGFIQLFIDGTLRETSNNPNAGSINDSEAQLHIGKHSTDNTSERQWRGSIALVRHSASIPSAEQIKKMYEDEKVLFRPNAKATLHGSSDAVTALAYDDTTNILHVGTTAGRSEFQGLLRINNTTDPVTAAISASNDLVAEK